MSLTALAVLTGADTRKLTQVRNSETYRQPHHEARQFLEEVTPGGSWTHRLSPENRKQLESKVAAYLGQVDDDIRTILESFEEDGVDEKQIAAGTGLFYFETDTF